MADRSRVLAFVDDSGSALRALETAVELAGRRRVPAQAVFVEELDLVHAAGFPFATEIGVTTGAARHLDADRLSVRLRERADRLRAHLAATAARQAVTWEFDVARGRLPAEIHARAAAGDWMVVGRVGWSSARGVRLGGTARRLATAPPCPVLFVPAEPPAAGVAGVAVASGAADETLLPLAVALRLSADEPVVLLAGAAGAGDDGEAAMRWLAERGIPHRVSAAGAARGADLADRVARERARVLVLSAGHPALHGEGAAGLVAAAQVPVMLVP